MPWCYWFSYPDFHCSLNVLDIMKIFLFVRRSIFLSFLWIFGVKLHHRILTAWRAINYKQMTLIPSFFNSIIRLRNRLSKSSVSLCIFKFLTILSIISTEIIMKRPMSRLDRFSLWIRGSAGGMA